MGNTQTIKLNTIEQVFHYITLEGDENVIGISILEKDAKIKQLTRETLTEALFYMCKRHPFLRAQITLSGYELYLKIKNIEDVKKKEIKFDWLKLESSKELTKELETFNAKLFDYKNELLWRFKVFEYQENNIDKFAFTIVVPHTITDGLNISVLVIEIVNLVNAILTGKECDEMRGKFDPIDDMHKLIEKSGLMNDKKKKLINEANQQDNDVYFVLDKKFQNENDSGIKINLLAIERETTLQILEYAKLNKIKLTGFIQAAMFYTIKQLYNENGLVLQDDMSSSIALNLRMRMIPKVDLAHIRMLISIANLNLKQFNKFENIWQDASLINEIIQDETCLDNGAFIKQMHKTEDEVMKFIMSGQLDKKPTEEELQQKCDIGLSNIGVYLNEKQLIDGPLRIVEIYHGNSYKGFPSLLPALTLHATTWNDSLMLELSTNRTAFSAKYADRFMELFENIIRNSV